jgi:hypothetical protein
MKIKYGKGTTEFGPGVDIVLDSDEVATAIDAYLVAHSVHIAGPRTITIGGKLCKPCKVYVDPSGWVNTDDDSFSGRGPGRDDDSRAYFMRLMGYSDEEN